ncbi:TrmH family RNA methyltransferase [Nitrospira sp. M1]
MTSRFQTISPRPSNPADDHERRITSAQNTHFKRWISLCERKGIRKHGQCLVAGRKIIQETLSRHPTLCREYLCTSQHAELPELPEHVRTFKLANTLFQQLDTAGTAFPLLVCHTPAIPSANLSVPPEGVEVLCPLSNPNNLGTLIRSCSAFGVQKLIVLQEAANPFHPKAIRASSGTIFNQSLWEGPKIRDLSHHEICRWIVSLDLKGDDLSTWEWPENIRLLVGEEGLGLPDAQFQHTLMIPQAKTVDSLNAAMATSIALFAYRQQFPL